MRIDSVSMVKVSELKPHPKNRNKHTDEQIERLAKIIEYQGWRYPVKVSKQSGFITSGHGRVLAAQLRGWDEVPVSFQDYDSDDQEYLDVQSDNAIASWAELDFAGINFDLADLSGDIDLDLLGIKDFVLEPAEKLGLVDEDEVPEPKESIAKLGDIWILGNHRVMCGDSTNLTNVEKLMNSDMADCIWTDPPYNVNYEGGSGLKIMNDQMENDKFFKFLYDAHVSMFSFSKDGAAIYVAHADSEGLNFRKALIDSGFLLKQCLIWVKQQLVMGRQDYHWRHEPILYGWKPGAAHNWYSDRKQSTVLEFDRPRKNGEHPTMKPVELIEYCLRNSSPAHGIVLDLFGGSGSTLIACEKLSRKCRTMELDPHYVDVIIARWEQFTGAKATRLETSP